MRTLQTPDGVRYTVEHERLVELVQPTRMSEELLTRFAPKGGTTTVKVYDAADNVICVSMATCSDKENFNAKRGHQIALGRALCKLSGEAAARRERADQREREHVERTLDIRHVH